MLQTLWYIESVVTELVLIFSIRTSGFFLKAKRPSTPLVLSSVLAFLVVVGLPYTAFGREFFHFVVPPIAPLFTVLGLIAAYFAVSEIIKLLYYRYRIDREDASQNK